MNEIDRGRARDAKVESYYEAAGRALTARERKNARRWLRRNGYPVN